MSVGWVITGGNPEMYGFSINFDRNSMKKTMILMKIDGKSINFDGTHQTDMLGKFVMVPHTFWHGGPRSIADAVGGIPCDRYLVGPRAVSGEVRVHSRRRHLVSARDIRTL